MLKVFLSFLLAALVVADDAALDEVDFSLNADRLYKPACKVNADLKTYEKVKAEYINMKKCHSEFKVSGLDAVKTKEEWKTAVDGLCDKVSEKVECIEKFNSAVRPCYTDLQWPIFVGGSNATVEFADAMCNDNREKLIEFAAKHGYDCYSKNVDKIVECMTLKIVSYAIETEPDSEEESVEETKASCFTLEACSAA